MYSEITIPKGVSATIQDGGNCWIVRLSFDNNIRAAPQASDAQAVRETAQTTEEPKAAKRLRTESYRVTEDPDERKRELARLRQKRRRERLAQCDGRVIYGEVAEVLPEGERDSVTRSVTLRDKKRDSVTESVTLRDTSRKNGQNERDMSRGASVTERDTSREGQLCLFDCLDGLINNKLINQSIKQTSVARSVTKRDMSRSASVTEERDEQLYLDLDYPLPPTIDSPKAREAWENWIRYRKYTGGCNRISRKVIREMFETLEFFHKTGGELAVVQILRYSTEEGRLNQLLVPRDVHQNPKPEPPKPVDEPVDPKDDALSKAMCREVLARIKSGRFFKPVEPEEVKL